MHWLPLPPGHIPATHFCQRRSQPQNHKTAGKIKSMKNPIDSIGNRICDHLACSTIPQPAVPSHMPIRGGTDKSLARPGRKQATATKLGIYSTYSLWSSIHFLARCSNFCRPLKKNSEGCPSNQVSGAAVTSTSGEKWRPFICFFSPGNRW